MSYVLAYKKSGEVYKWNFSHMSYIFDYHKDTLEVLKTRSNCLKTKNYRNFDFLNKFEISAAIHVNILDTFDQVLLLMQTYLIFFGYF